MKILRYISIFLLPVMVASCVDPNAGVTDFGTDSDEIRIGPDGGRQKIKISSAGAWIASTDDPWITISPANGRGSVECDVIIDSTLIPEARTGYVRIQNLQGDETKKEISVSQDGYPYSITLDEPEVSVLEFAGYDKRSFEVKVRTNVDFDVVIPDNAGWISHKSYDVELDRGVRPRNVVIRFDWKVNSIPEERVAEIRFEPVDNVEMAENDVLKVTQNAAALIEPGTRKADSLAVMGISRALDMWISWENPNPMDEWENVTLWEERHEGYTPDKKGRVKSADFFMFSTKEGLPYEVQYLTAAEDLYFYSNTNSFLLDVNPGEYITKLTQLKRLTIGAYGLSELPASFSNLENLEYLNLSGNNFQKIPSVITKENFPKLHSLNINANQRKMVYDLSNGIQGEKMGGLIDEQEFPRHLLEWSNLDTLIVSVNYLQGEIPDMLDYAEKWTEADINSCDTLPPALIGKPKVLPKMKHLAINLNRLTGTCPDWILYHPSLDWWIPYIFVFSQEGKDINGKAAGFDNEPVNLNYYYDFYKGYKKNNTVEEEDETTESIN